MRILFICPSMSPRYIGHITDIAHLYWKEGRYLKRDLNRHIRSIRKMCYALGVLTLVPYVPADADVVFIDENAEKPEDVERLYREQEYDLVIITAQIFQHDRVMDLIHTFVERGIHVAVGGPNPTLFPDDYIRDGVSVVLSEAEDLFTNFLTDFQNREPKPVYARKQGDCVDIDNSRHPPFALISDNRYNLVGMQATRGCPHRCRFCNAATIAGSAYRQKPVERIRKEIATVKNYWPDSAFLFHDDNMFADRDFTLELFQELQGINLGQWTTSSDISIAEDDELLDAIAANGRPRICFGLETLSAANKKALGNSIKQASQPLYGEKIEKIKKRGIDVIGSFVFGFPGDGAAEINEMVAFIEEYQVHGSINRLFASPGSRLYDDLLRECESSRGPLAETGMARARVVNEFYMEKNGFDLEGTEDLIFSTLKRHSPDRLPMLAIGNLAAFRTFMI